MTEQLTNSAVNAALGLLANLHRQAGDLRKELTRMRTDMARLQIDFSEMQGIQLIEANENLILAVLRAETAAETAFSDLGELEQSSQRDALLRLAIDSAHIGEWEMDLASGDIRHSLRHDMCFGHSELQSRWNVGILLQHVHPDDRASFAEDLSRASHHKTDWRTICQVVWPDASVHWVSIHGGLFEEGGHPARLLGIITDITELKLAADARHKLVALELENHQILEASRLKSQFISNMSHELRTPLNAIIGFGDLLYMGLVPSDSPKHREYLGHIGSSARHLLRLINDVLDLSKVESGKFQFYPDKVDLRQLVRELVDVLGTSLQRSALSFDIDIDPNLPVLFIDPDRLKQVLYNYLSNAIKFTPEGGKVTVRARAEGGEWFRLEVEDTGIGIAAKDLPRLFVDFQQLDAGHSRLHQGTGLGLALTRRLVEAQGGGVGVRSTVGEGSVFHAVLRCSQVPAP